MVSVDVKHHVYLLTYSDPKTTTKNSTNKQTKTKGRKTSATKRGTNMPGLLQLWKRKCIQRVRFEGSAHKGVNCRSKDVT